MQSWSALSARGDLPRVLPGAAAASLLLLPLPRPGLFWTIGNPATLGEDLPPGRTDFAVAIAGQRGEYRRPLDPDRVQLDRASGLSWGRVTDRVAMIGRIVIDRQTDGRSSEAVAMDPHDSSPFLTTDTTSSPMRRDRSRLEGGSQWTFGDWLIGITLGYEARSQQTIEAGVVRRSRRAMPGATVGVARRVGWVTVGAHGSLRSRSEMYRLSERSFDAQVHELQGYQDVPTVDIILQYQKRLREYVPAVGAGLAGRGSVFAWSLAGERVWRREQQTLQQSNDPLKDRWDAEGWRAELMVEPRLGKGPLRLLGQVRYHTLSGRGDLALDTAGVVFTATEDRVEGRAELHLLPSRRGWTGALSVSLTRDQRLRADSAAGIRSDIRTLSPNVGLELGWTSGRALVAATTAWRHQRANAEIPDDRVRGSLYQRLFAPELDIYARAATSIALGAVGRVEVTRNTSLWIQVLWEQLSRSADVPVTLFAPGARRSAWSVMGGVTLTPR